MTRLTLILALAVGCGSEGDFTESEAGVVFDDSNGQLHALHIDAFALAEWPETFTYDCPGGGRVDMVTVDFTPEATALNLEHEFVGCAVGDVVFDGRIDYLEIEDGLCGGSGFAIEIVGDVEVSGALSGSCSMNASELCGEFSGDACGHSL